MVALSYAPFGDVDDGNYRPKPYIPVPAYPKGSFASDNTECNYVAMAFVLGIIVLGIVDSLRK